MGSPDSEPSELRDEPGCGWIACTTDSILAMKSALYDVLITMPPPYSEDAKERVWPKVESPQGVEMKATQRDLRRYKALRWGLSRHVSPSQSPDAKRSSIVDFDDDGAPQTSSSSNFPRDDPMLDLPDTESIVEPVSWSALAYSGFMWWASAGEQRLSSEEEADSDAILLTGLSLSPSTPSTPRNQSQSSVSLASKGKDGEQLSAKQEMSIIAYFHRLTSQILTTLSDIVDATDSDDERENEGSAPLNPSGDGLDQEETGPPVYINSADFVRMGLDIWSVKDYAYVEEVAKAYFGRRAHIEGRNVDVCGVRIC